MGLWDLPAQHYVGDTELRFNPYHDPTNGRFTSGSGGAGGGYLYVGKGQKGKGAYVFERDIDSEYEAWSKSKAAAQSKDYKYRVKNENNYFTGKGNFTVEVGYTPSKSFPEIEAVSDKQKNYASDLRERYVSGKMSQAYSRVEGIYRTAKLDQDVISNAFKSHGFKDKDDFVNKFIESDDNMQFIMSEKSARKIIDRLR